MAGEKPFPLYTDGTSVFYTTDGVHFTSVGGGGSATIHTSSPLSGDGSVGTPATIANGAITSAKLATPPQDPAAVAITGGTITGVNAATRSVQGAMAAADKAFLDDVYGWQRTQYATMIAAVPALTGFGFAKVGLASLNQTTGALTDDGNIEGGAMKNGNAQSKVYGASIFQNTAGGNWAIFGRAILAVPSSGVNSQFGIQSANSAHSVIIASTNGIDATHWYGEIFATSATDVIFTNVANANFHDFGITDDGTTVKWWIDGSLAGSTATRTHLTTEPMQPFIFGAATTPPVLQMFMYGYVRP
jgi:hypothetical protein